MLVNDWCNFYSCLLPRDLTVNVLSSPPYMLQRPSAARRAADRVSWNCWFLRDLPALSATAHEGRSICVTPDCSWLWRWCQLDFNDSLFFSVSSGSAGEALEHGDPPVLQTKRHSNSSGSAGWHTYMHLHHHYQVSTAVSCVQVSLWNVCVGVCRSWRKHTNWSFCTVGWKLDKSPRYITSVSKPKLCSSSWLHGAGQG